MTQHFTDEQHKMTGEPDMTYYIYHEDGSDEVSGPMTLDAARAACRSEDDVVTTDPPTDVESNCPACGDPIDYCPGHGESGDPQGHSILAAHDDEVHDFCHWRSECVTDPDEVAAMDADDEKERALEDRA